MIELKECVRLRARITERTCSNNRKRVDDPFKDVWAVKECIGCPGLGVVVEEIREDVSVAKKICNVEGCNTQVHARGYCWKHEKSELGINPNTGKPLDKKMLKVVKADAKSVKVPVLSAAPPPVTEELCQSCGVSPCCCHILLVPDVVDACSKLSHNPAGVTLSDMGLELDRLFGAKRQEWLENLASETSVRSRARNFLAMCDALEGMAY